MRFGWYTGVGLAPFQPMPFSHKHHAGQLGIDCRYCHTEVEVSESASYPLTYTCMTCHSQIWTGAPVLEPVVWLMCLALLAAMVGSYYLDLGPWNVVVNLGIAFAKASLIFWFFMHVREGTPLVRLFAAGGLFWLAVMFGLGLSDWLTRSP